MKSLECKACGSEVRTQCRESETGYYCNNIKCLHNKTYWNCGLPDFVLDKKSLLASLNDVQTYLKNNLAVRVGVFKSGEGTVKVDVQLLLEGESIYQDSDSTNLD
jgi:hypothetical protein